MGIKDMFKGKQNSDNSFNNDYSDNGYYDNFDDNSDQNDVQEDDDRGMQGSGMYQNQPMGGGMSLNGSAIELKVVKPERFDSVSQIAEQLINRKTVVLNLESTNKETARRLIDFLSGVAFSIDGQMKRVANSTYVITPSNVDISSENLRSKNSPPTRQSGDTQPPDDYYGDQ